MLWRRACKRRERVIPFVDLLDGWIALEDEDEAKAEAKADDGGVSRQSVFCCTATATAMWPCQC